MNIYVGFSSSKDFRVLSDRYGRRGCAEGEFLRHFEGKEDDANLLLASIHHEGDLSGFASKVTDYGMVYKTVELACKNDDNNGISMDHCLILHRRPEKTIAIVFDLDKVTAKVDYGRGTCNYHRSIEEKTACERIWITFYCSLIEENKGFKGRILEHMDSKDRAGFALFCHYMGLN